MRIGAREVSVNPPTPLTKEVVVSKSIQQVLVGVILVVIGGGLLCYALVMAPPQPAMIRAPLQPLDWPIALLAMLICLSGVLTVGGWIESHRGARQVPAPESSAFKVTLGTIASLVVYLVALPLFGFALATLLWLLVTLYIFGTKRLLLVLGLSVGISTVLFLLFTKVMIVALPRGMWIFETFSRLIGH